MDTVTLTGQHPTTVSVLRAAAAVIERDGYTLYPGYEGETGRDVLGAITAAAAESDTGAEEVESAFCGWLLMRGMLTGTHHSTADNLINIWESDARPAGAAVAAEFRAAAAALQTTAYAYGDSEAATVRRALSLAEVSSRQGIGKWLEANDGPAVAALAEGIEYSAAFTRSRALIRQLAYIIGQLTQ